MGEIQVSETHFESADTVDQGEESRNANKVRSKDRPTFSSQAHHLSAQQLLTVRLV